MTSQLDVNNIYYEKGDKKILNGISFSISRKNILGIAGQSGSGKTTLAKIISGLIKPTAGHVSFNNSYQNKSTPVQLLFQNSGEIINPYRKVWDMVSEIVKIKNPYRSTDYIKKETEDLLESFEISNSLWQRRGYELSGGEQQRTALARILASAPEIIVLDEPFSAQDPESEVRLINILKEINENKGISLICISHDITLLKKFCSHYLIMSEGITADSGLMSELENSESGVTKFLLKALNYNLKPEDFSR